MVNAFGVVTTVIILSDEPIPWSASSTQDYLQVELKFQRVNQSIDIEAQNGYLVMIHRTDELPSDSSFSFHKTDKSVDIEVTPKQTRLSQELQSLDVKRRNCYFEHEKSLELFKVYSKSNCEHECQSFAFAHQCGCVPFYLLSELYFCGSTAITI